MTATDYGTVTEIPEPDTGPLRCPRCDGTHIRPPFGYRLACCLSCGTAFDTMGDDPETVTVTATHEQLYAWAHRPRYSWPCSGLARCDSVTATLDGSNGDLIGLEVVPETAVDNILGEELTAWLDTCLWASPLHHLARTMPEVEV